VELLLLNTLLITQIKYLKLDSPIITGYFKVVASIRERGRKGNGPIKKGYIFNTIQINIYLSFAIDNLAVRIIQFFIFN
jgi:hypothetical protein